MQKCEPQERSPWAPKFEERTGDETLKQERCARREARNLAKNVCKLKKKEKDAFYSLAEALGNAGTILEKARGENSWSTPEHRGTC